METNIIYCGDCKDILKRYIPDESIDLIYLDPPFFSQKEYEDFWIKDKTTRTGFSDKDWEKLRDDIDPTILAECEAIEARWKGGKKGIYIYIAYMKERLIQCERVLKDTGSIALHCDWHAGHYLKVMMDEVFGYDNFINEIVWSYRTGGASRRHFSRKHDTIFWYGKTDNYTYNLFKERVYYEKPFFTSEVDEGGRYYADVFPVDVWEIPAVINVSKERLGYPTQKPEALLERIIRACSDKGDVVLDPFCGCGTALYVAKKLGRKYIGIDISRSGCDVTKSRLGDNPRVVGGETMAEIEAMKPHDFERWVIVEKLGGTLSKKRMSGDMGIDGWAEFKTVPVQVKQSDIGRPAIDNFLTSIKRDGKDQGIFVAYSFSSGAVAEVGRAETKENIKIRLVTVKDLISG